MNFRSEIEGLRAIALLSVILFHAGFKEFSGGFLGVDIFFVISGYLNTKIIIAELQQNKFSIINFYERRIKRILPMLYLVMFICIPFAWLLMSPNDIDFFAKSLVTTSAFVSNLFFLHNDGYFAEQERFNPLLATWSLAVEIQFYFLLPFFLMKIWRLSKRWIFVILGIGLLISFLLMQWVAISNQSAAFYLLPTRIWEFVFGIYAAFFLSKAHPKKIKGGFIAAAGWLGAALILLAIFTYDNKTSSTSIYQLAATFGTVLIILFTTRQTSAGKAIGNKVFVGIGLISYSAYLWHQPVFAFYRYQYFHEPNFNNCLFLISFVFILAYLSWRFVEMSLRKNHKFKRSNIFLLSFLCSIVFIILGSITVLNKNTIKSYWLNRSSDINLNFNKMLLEKNVLDNNGNKKFSTCNFSLSKFDSEVEKKLKECFTLYGAGVLIIGDSHAINLFGAIHSRFDHKFIVSLAQPGCRPYIVDPQCNYDKIASFLSKNGKIFSLLIYEQSGSYLFNKEKTLKGLLSIKSSLLSPRNEIDYDSINKVFIYLNNLAKFTHVKWFMPRIETEIYRDVIIRKNLGCEYPYSPTPNQILKYKLLDGEIKKIGSKSQNNKIQLISQNELFNFKFPADFVNCKEIYWSDSDHFSYLGEIRFGKRLPKNFLDSE
jgi:peptidoglycan/LPS O-acetylase OafA/YrhL